MSLNPQAHRPGLLRTRRRLKIAIACQACRSKKIKCDGIRPACGNCQKRDGQPGTCAYAPRVIDAPSPRPTVPRDPPPTDSGQQDGHEARGINPGSGSLGAFASDVKAAIDARLGLPSGRTLNLVPMTDAPLFGMLSRPRVTDSTTWSSMDNVLPPRKHADHLMGLYWRHIHILDPFLDQELFTHWYHSLFAGSSLDIDERIFISTLNVVFALSTQLQEDLQPEQRDEASSTYFGRAWTLLHPELIIWEPGSLELVQCLLLMGRYLQCTSSTHQTWMAVGSAVRIAQSLGLHMPEPSSMPLRPDSRRRRQLWQCCVFMDRAVSWMFGRTSVVPLAVPSHMLDILRSNDKRRVPCMDYLTKIIELYEISNHIMISQTPPSSVTDMLGLSRMYQNQEYFVTAVHLDTCLTKWEKNLPQSLRLDVSESNVYNNSQVHAIILRLRFLHSRIMLFKPMLARFCLTQFQTTASTLDQGLGDRVLQGCASVCVDTAQKMVSLIDKCHTPGETIGLLPWWHRVFYLHVAGTILIAAMLRSDLYTPTAAQSWAKAMLAFHAHDHLSPFILQCSATFETLSCNILGTHRRGSYQINQLEVSPDTYFQDIFQDIGFDPDNFLFGKDDMSWLGNFESN